MLHWSNFILEKMPTATIKTYSCDHTELLIERAHDVVEDIEIFLSTTNYNFVSTFQFVFARREICSRLLFDLSFQNKSQGRQWKEQKNHWRNWLRRRSLPTCKTQRFLQQSFRAAWRKFEKERTTFDSICSGKYCSANDSRATGELTQRNVVICERRHEEKKNSNSNETLVETSLILFVVLSDVFFISLLVFVSSPDEISYSPYDHFHFYRFLLPKWTETNGGKIPWWTTRKTWYTSWKSNSYKSWHLHNTRTLSRLSGREWTRSSADRMKFQEQQDLFSFQEKNICFSRLMNQRILIKWWKKNFSIYVQVIKFLFGDRFQILEIHSELFPYFSIRLLNDIQVRNDWRYVETW